MESKKGSLGRLEKWKFPALVLLLGLALLFFPGGSGKEKPSEGPDEKIQELLSSAEGVGRSKVLISENGVVVLCEGAALPQVRLDIIRAIGSYTGFGSDKITILKMADAS